VQHGAGGRGAHLVLGTQVDLVRAATDQTLELMTRGMSRQLHFVRVAIGPPVEQCVTGDGCIAREAALPVHQDAARGGTGHIQNGRCGWHLDHQSVGQSIGADAIVHLATVVASIGQLQAGDDQISAVQ